MTTLLTQKHDETVLQLILQKAKLKAVILGHPVKL